MNHAPAAFTVMMAGCAALSAAAPASAGDPERGQQLYESRCVACHSLDQNRVGPRHRGVFGRPAGSLADYDYSKALKQSGITWGRDTLDAWLTDPGKLVPGQKMGFRVAAATDRDDIISFLETRAK